jgi:O-antigen/teichoic acid export membrane protein
MIRNGTLFAVLLLPCFLLLGIFPWHVMVIAYGPHSPYLQMAPLLRIVTVTFVLQFLAVLIGAYEGGMSRPKTYMFAQISCLIVLATIGVGAMYKFGVSGAVYAGVIAALARLITFIVLSRRADRALMLELSSSKS